MEDNGLGKYTASYGVSLAITCVLSALLVPIKELNKPLFTLMAKATTHHWITHGVFDVIVFVVLGWALAQLNGGTGLKTPAKSLINMIVGAVVIGGLIIAGFYLFVG